jgi:hypothetical protein
MIVFCANWSWVDGTCGEAINIRQLPPAGLVLAVQQATRFPLDRHVDLDKPPRHHTSGTRTLCTVYDLIVFDERGLIRRHRFTLTQTVHHPEQVYKRHPPTSNYSAVIQYVQRVP